MKWYTYQGSILVDPRTYAHSTVEEATEPVLMASCLSRNGAYGAILILKVPGGYVLEAGGNDSGKSWKTPDTIFNTISEAAEKAESLWRPI